MRALRFGSYSIAATTAGDAVLVALEIDLAIGLLVPAAAEARRDAARAAAAAGAASCPRPGSFPGVCLVMSSRDTTVWKRRVGVVGLISFDRHGSLDLRVLRHLLAGLQPHVGLLPVRAVAGETGRAAAACPPWWYVRTSATFTLNSGLDGVPDLGLIGVRPSTSKHSVRSASFLVTPFSVTMRPLDDFVYSRHSCQRLRQVSSPPLRVSSTCWCPSRSYTLTSRLATSFTPSRFRLDSSRLRFSRCYPPAGRSARSRSRRAPCASAWSWARPARIR